MKNDIILSTEQIELELICDALYQKYGYDFRNYSRASLLRQVKAFVKSREISPISGLIPMILYDKTVFSDFVFSITVNVTDMFRNPEFFLAFRLNVVPVLRTYPYFKIWIAGCSTGEEVYSLAILLEEEKLLERARIYGTDINDLSLSTAGAGKYPLKIIDKYSENYVKSGGKKALSDYFNIKGNYAEILPELKKNIFFANHNLATDWVFSEIHCILCRNVLIYFNRKLQKRVLDVFNESLLLSGILCLGKKENLMDDKQSHHFIPFVSENNIFKKESSLS